MRSPARNPTSRLAIVDALRGSALLGILLLHAIEHWELLRYPADSPAWLHKLNMQTDEFGIFLFSGKAYAIFAMMFGLSFHLILNRWSKREGNVEGRYLWRLAVLGIFGYLNGLIYCGDILLVLAVLGIPLVWLNRLGNRALLGISVILVLQIPLLWETVRVLSDQGFQPPPHRYLAINEALYNVFANGSFIDVIKANLWQGQLSRIWWTIETGRHTQMLGLFIWGMLLGRARVFENSAYAVRLAKRALLCGLIGFAAISAVKWYSGAWGLTDMRLYVLHNLLISYNHLALMAVWVGGFVLLYQWTMPRMLFRLLEPLGRMSLTCYVTQGLFSVPLFYGFGLALYRTMGPFYSVLYGALFFLIQAGVAHLWLMHFQYGPLEWLWRCATFTTFQVPFRRRQESASENEVCPNPNWPKPDLPIIVTDDRH